MNIKKLFNRSVVSLYWLGFILADGSVSDINRLTLSLSLKDEKHLRSFAEYVEYQYPIRYNKNISCQVSHMNQEFLSRLNDYGIAPRKTYNPPNCEIYNVLSNSEFLCFLVGFIDGDGQIRKQYKRRDAIIQLKCHKSWFQVFEYFRKRLIEIFEIDTPPPYINQDRDGYAVIAFSNSLLVNKMKKFVLENELPVIDRKWSLIDETYITRCIQAKVLKDTILKYIPKGATCADIAKYLNVPVSNVSTAEWKMRQKGLIDRPLRNRASPKSTFTFPS